MEKKKGFLKINKNLVAYIYLFLSPQEMFKFGKISKKFLQALNSDYIYEDIVLKEELFVERSDIQSWKKYYFYLLGIKKNFKSGKPNISFKMNALRGHTNYITCLNYFEDFNRFYVFSG